MEASAATRTALAVAPSRHPAPFTAAAPRRQRARRVQRPAAAGDGEDEPAGQLPPPPPPPARPRLSARALDTAASSEPGSSEFKWAEQYKAQGLGGTGSSSGSSGGSSGYGVVAGPSDVAGSSAAAPSPDEPPPFVLPVMTLSKVKLPTESVPLQIFEPRYRLMFKLVNGSASRRFGVVLADKERGQMESVGALCELTHFVTVPERRRIFFNARVVGRFETQQVLADKPFVAVLARSYEDVAPQGLAEQLQLAALEMRVWQTMQEVRQLASKLFAAGGSPLGNEIFSLEVRRWAPDAEARAGVPTAAGADPTLMRMVELAGLLGEEGTLAERTTEYVCSDALREECSDAERRERFSFALARTLDFGPEALQRFMYSQDTGERLAAAEALILEGRNYLAARSTLRDAF